MVPMLRLQGSSESAFSTRKERYVGLDVYLYTRDEEERSNLHNEASEAFYGQDNYESLTEEEKKAGEETIPPYVSAEDTPSHSHPDHMFNRRYLRSSYNKGGFNSAVPDFTGEDHGLYWIFEPVRGDTDEYSFEMTEGSITALEEAKTRSLQVAEELRACDRLRVGSAEALIGTAEHLWQAAPSEEHVLSWYREEAKRFKESQPPWGESYSNAKGTILGFSKGTEVLAITVGEGVFGHPEAFFVYRAEDADWYVQAAEITAEFCDEAIELVRRDGSAFIHWSG